MIHYGRKELEPGAREAPAATTQTPDQSTAADSSAEPDEGRVPALIY